MPDLDGYTAREAYERGWHERGERNHDEITALRQLVAQLHQAIHALYRDVPEAQEQYRAKVEEVLRGGG